MAYVGNQPVPQATQTRDRFVATSGQTSFATSGYTPNFVDVYLDGVKLDSSEYTATNGSDVVLDSGATTGQILEVVAFSSFDVADIRNMTQPLGLKNYTTTQRNALTNIGAGDTIYNSTTGSIEFYDGANWIATNLIPTVNSVTGTIYSGAASTLTLSLTNATDVVTVRFAEGGITVADVADVSVSSGSASVTVPAAVYGQTAGDTISVSILNQDKTPSSNAITKTVVAIPTGGTVTSSSGYIYHTFTSSGTFTVPSGFTASANYLLVAGGGSGGSDSGGANGGGGAGGYISGNLAISSAGSFSVVIGAGGPGTSANDSNNNGSNSSFNSQTAIGGGGGGARGADTANDGGSGGGSSSSYSSISNVGAGTSGQGNRGGYGLDQSPYYPSGGGGGAGAVGNNYASTSTSGSGGSGSQWLDGNYYAGGGGGGAYAAGNYGTGGTGGGGRGGVGDGGTGVSGSANTGGGGGGGGNGNGTSGSGGSGVVIIRYQLS